MKKYLAMIMSGVMALTLATGCGSSNNSSNAADSSKADSSAISETSGTTSTVTGDFKTIKDGVLMVGMEIGYPPMEYMDEDGTTPIGFDVEFSKAVAEKLGLKVEYVNTAWDGIFTSLDSNRYDCAFSCVSITDERKQNYCMTEPYVANKICIVAKNDSGITSPDDLGGKKVCTQTETTSDIFMRDKMKNGLNLTVNDTYFVYDQVINCFNELKLGRVDAVVVDSVVASYYIGKDKDTYKVVWESTDAEPIGACFKKGNDALKDAVEKAIDDLYADGTYKTIAERYFGEGNTVATR